MIRFKLRPEEHGGYRVEALEPAGEVFADLVNHDLFGSWGVQQVLERVQEVLSGSAPPLSLQCNVYEIVADEATTRVEFRDECGACTTAEFVAFLREILVILDRLAIMLEFMEPKK